MSAPYTYWKDEDGWYVGFWNEYPDYSTQGRTLAELQKMLVSLRMDINEMVADGTMPDNRRNVGELAFA
jgi:hypothetical protein